MNQKLEEIVLLRGFSILGIVLLHVTSNFIITGKIDSLSFKTSLILNQIVRFSLPLFLVISGIALAYNYDRTKGVNILTFITSRAKKILVPYLSWSIIYFSFYILYLNQIPIDTKILSIDQVNLNWINILQVFLKNLLFGWNYVHLYFIILIFQFYLLYPFIIKRLVRTHNPKRLVFSNIISYLGLITYLFYFKKQTGILGVDVFLKFYWELFFSWYIYFLLGLIIGLYYKGFLAFCEKHFWKSSVFYFLTLLLVLAEALHNTNNVGKLTSLRPTVFLNTLAAIVFYYHAIVMLARLKSRLVCFLKLLGEMSFGIYFIHLMILTIISRNLINNFPQTFSFHRTSFMVMLSLITVIFSMLMVKIIENTPLCYPLTGYVKNKK